ncbi:ovochymase-like isoform 1-T2 [Cochliomyia hominivorax]
MFWLIILLSVVTHVNSKYGSSCLTPNQQAGFCMPVKSCKPIYDILKKLEENRKTISKYHKSELAKYHCGTFENDPHVCCLENEIQLNVEGLNILKSNTCGDFQMKISNGPNADLFQFPWVALIIYEDNFKCGGTLISDKYVLTAAHCVKGREHLIEIVRLGEYQINNSIDCSARGTQCSPPVEDVGIEKVIIHENYQNIYNDIALIRLNRKVEFTRHIKPICLPIYKHLRSKELNHYILTGWGITEKNISSEILKTSLIYKMNQLECEKKFQKYNLHYSLNEEHICTSSGNSDYSCHGDSGGAIGGSDLYEGSQRFIQYGILSIAPDICDIENVPYINTKVSHYIQWITDNLKNTSTKVSHQHRIPCATPSLKNGFCVPYNECPFVIELQQNYSSYEAIPKYYIDGIIKSRCSQENEPIRLCCEFRNNFKSQPPSSTEIPRTKPKIHHSKLLDFRNETKLHSQNKSEQIFCITPSQESGICVPYKECSFLKELVETFKSIAAIPEYYTNFVKQSKCSKDNEPIRICCKLYYINNKSRTATTDVPRDNWISASERPVHQLDKYCQLNNSCINREKTYHMSIATTNIAAINKTKLIDDLEYDKDFISQLNTQGLQILKALKCGNSGGDRVAGGNETNLAEFPWMALLRCNTSINEFNCGGSLISNRYVLTATHCVNNDVYPIVSVRLGEHDIKTNPDCRQIGKKFICNPVVEDYGIEKIIIHPKYNGKKHINDIALIKLDRNVVFKNHIKPVCLPITTQSFEMKSTTFTIAGWGITETSSKSSVLLKAEVLAYSRSVCQAVFSNMIKLNEKHICAGGLQTRRSTCRGDSGGPLVAFNSYSETKRFIQYGIIAHGGDACNLRQGFPGIYTNVLTFLPWITNNIID